jgi:hypothetical protein
VAGTLEPIVSHSLKPRKVLLSSPKGSKCHATEADIEGFLDINSQTSSKENPSYKETNLRHTDCALPRTALKP